MPTQPQLISLLVVVCAMASAGDGDDREYFDRRPFLQGLLSTSVFVISQSEDATSARIEWARQGEPPNEIAEPDPTNEHVFRLQGLEPNTYYQYTVFHGRESMASASFRTLPEEGGTFTFGVIGDSGALSEEQIALASIIEQEAPDLLLHTGDIVYPAGSAALYQRNFFDVYESLLGATSFYPSIGNHDCWLEYDAWLDAFHTPANNDLDDETYYSFDAGDAHIVCLNTCDWELPAVQQRWLEADLAGSDRRWKIVFFHHAVYSNSFHGGHKEIRASVVPIMERAGVDLVLTGHDHVYERFHPILDGMIVDAYHSPNYIRPRGPLYIVSGGGGASLYGHREGDDAGMSAVFNSVHHAVFAEVGPERITLRAVNDRGEEIDRFSIEETGDRPELDFLRGDANASGHIDLSDAIATLGYLFLGERPPCLESADTDDSGKLGVADAIRSLLFLFRDGPPPAPPFPDCGIVESPDDRGCLTSCGNNG